jgi:hypothetical protein
MGQGGMVQLVTREPVATQEFMPFLVFGSLPLQSIDAANEVIRHVCEFFKTFGEGTIIYRSDVIVVTYVHVTNGSILIPCHRGNGGIG